MKEQEEERFSEDEEENLQIENNILKLKLQAELGAEYEIDEAIPADVENAILRNVIEFEHQYANAPTKTLYEVLGKPDLIPANKLNDQEISQALHEITQLMSDKGIEVDYEGEYDDRLKYKFVTEELLLKESMFVDVPGMTMQYVYEEFHPNHTRDLESKAKEFSKHWEQKQFDAGRSDFADELIVPGGVVYQKEQLLEKLDDFFNRYDRFENLEFKIENISYEMAGADKGLAFVEGTTGYDAIAKDGSVQRQEGPIKLCLEYEEGWSIYYFVWPGFTW